MVARLSAVSLNYFEFLPTSAHVGGIGVLSTGSCGISANTVVMNVSTVLGTEGKRVLNPFDSEDLHCFIPSQTL